ncbi:MAG: cation:proton antiporter, partial [Methanomicrobiaceae archaeon]|nr:cation:proton antiporter [Methanomicrobiaceae archaeon]
LQIPGMDKENCRMTGIFLFAVAVFAGLILVTMVRLFLGPTVPDRVVALDTINTLTVASMIVLAVAYQQTIFVDVAIVYALLSFVGTLYIAKYVGGDV